MSKSAAEVAILALIILAFALFSGDPDIIDSVNDLIRSKIEK